MFFQLMCFSEDIFYFSALVTTGFDNKEKVAQAYVNPFTFPESMVPVGLGLKTA